MLNARNLKEEYQEILTQLSDPELISDWERFQELNKKKQQIEQILEKEKEIEELKNRIAENRTILNSPDDYELASLAETELVQLSETLRKLEQDLEKLLHNDSEETTAKPNIKAVIVEIRAGTGGDEAAIFVADLFKMYSKYATANNWPTKILDSHPSSLNGFKEIVFEITGPEAFNKIKNEAGVHRVQRIPATEKAGRIHTSTASVAVLAKPKKGKVNINPSDLKVDTYKASGPGGQYVNKRMTAVRITHLPTGLVVTSQNERNLQQNRDNALSILEARLLEKQESEITTKMGQKRKEQIGKAERSEKIRTYNFPQSRITDHRIKKSFHNLEEIMEGKLEAIITNLEKLTQS